MNHSHNQNSSKLEPFTHEHSDIVFDMTDEIVDVATAVYRRLFSGKSAETESETTLQYEDGHVWIGLA
jgi:hypothetical protein